MDIEELKKYQIIIYGTGYIADKFFKVLQMNQMESNLVCFVKSNASEGETKNNYCVKNLKDVCIGENTMVCIAVHESNLYEILDTVKCFTQQYIWIYPYIYDWLLGGICEKEKNVSIGNIISQCKKDLRMAIRLMAIECYYGKNDIGYDVYLRAEGMHCNRETVQNRLSCFQKLIKSWENDGYSKNHVISVNQLNEIIDGNHRTSLAIYHQIETITCNVYRTKLSPVEVHGPEAMIVPSALQKNGFSLEEINMLWNIQNQYYKFYVQ